MSAKIRPMAKNRFPQRSTRELCILIIKLLLVSGLAALTVFNSIAGASSEAVRWTRVSIPTEGEAGNWVLATGSDVRHLTMAPDGTLYACGQGLTYTLYKSTDGGLSWVHIGSVQDTIVDIAVSPHDASIIYYATSSAVYRSTNSGKTFAQLPAGPGGAGTDNKEITSIDVACLTSHIIAVGTRDTDGSEFGGVYTLDEANIIPDWEDTNIGSYDVYAVAFSPNYPSDRQLVAVITDEANTFIAARVNDASWSATTGYARLDRDNSGTPTSVAVTAPAAIAFPDNYDADPASGGCVLYVAIDSGAGEGDVYKINCADAPYTSRATDLNIGGAYGQSNIDITGLTACGDYPSIILLAGAADSTRTYTSTDGGVSWTRSRKEPAGQSTTCVLLAPDFTTTGRMYAATSGQGSAFSISRDIGDTWNQLSLIDTAVDTIIDLAPSPDYTGDNTLFMLTFGSGHSLWRSRDGGNTWERILASNLAGVDSLNLVALPPQYGADCRTVFVAGESNGSPCVWQSTDDGQNYRRRFTRDPDTGATFAIDAWAIAGENTFYAGSFNGSYGMVYQTTNGGFFYSEGAMSGSQSLYSLALSPGHERDGIILAGNTNGWVYLSSDNGTSFQPLPGDAASPPLTGSIAIAFDPGFESNNTVYAASNTADGGVYRFVIGTDTDWESIDGTMPAGTIFNGLTVILDGALYAVNSDDDGGMERCLNPTYALGPSFETVTRGLEDGATLFGLWRSDCRLWSVDTTNIRLMTFYDTLTSPVVQVFPDDGASGIGNLTDHAVRNISLDWETLDGATGYEWQCDYDTDFSSVPDGFEGTTTASSARLPSLEPATTYYWRVRASAPVLSPWSEKWSFTTSLDTEAIALKPESPAAGASGVPVKPLFQWTAVVGANAYELLVSTDADFSSPAVVRTGEFALPTNAWRCDVSLDYDTTYYWKVRATSASTRSTWSAAGVFTTESPPEDTEPASPPPSYPQDTTPEITPSLTTAPLPSTPSPMQLKPPLPASSPQEPFPMPSASQSPSIPGWTVYIVGALLLAIILALIIILTMVLK
ncbi:MAG: hypothetical protein KAW90_05570, partial [Dehalococcoidales bacterium]|nr:hypothetical protein [Dehalococcoidales bacterium]